MLGCIKQIIISGMLKRFARFVIQVILVVSTRVKVEGMENIPEGGAFIGVSNHLGRLDPLIPYQFLKRDDITMLVAEKYKNVILLNWFVKILDGIWVDRFNADLGAIREALGRLKKGQILVVAPEGTRSKSEALIEARSGTSYLAARTGVPVLPVALWGTEDRGVVNHLLHLRRAPVHVNIGKVFRLEPVKGADREAELKNRTDEIMCRIAALLPEKYRGFYAQHPRTLELIEQTKVKAEPASSGQPASLVDPG